MQAGQKIAVLGALIACVVGFAIGLMPYEHRGLDCGSAFMPTNARNYEIRCTEQSRNSRRAMAGVLVAGGVVFGAAGFVMFKSNRDRSRPR